MTSDPGVHKLEQPMQLRAHERIDTPSIPQVRLIADMLAEQAETLAGDAAKRREIIRKQARNGTPSQVTEGRMRQADEIDDRAAELFALAAWAERQGRS